MQSNNINIQAGATINLPCQGNGIWFESGTSTTANLYIIVKPESGTEFRLKPGQHVQEPSNPTGTWRIRAEDPTAVITGSVIIGSGDFADNNTLNKVTLDATFANNVTVMNSTANRVPVALDPNATLNLASNVLAYTHKHTSTAATGSNVPVNMLPAATNVNGALLSKFDAIAGSGTGGFTCTVLANAVAPTGIQDGDVLFTWYTTGTNINQFAMDLAKNGQIKVPAGKGIWYITNLADNCQLRDALFTVL